jgi:hypothetical protein
MPVAAPYSTSTSEVSRLVAQAAFYNLLIAAALLILGHAEG